MAANSSLELVNLDFDTNKGSLAAFLNNQDIFKDYNFGGSDLNVLMDLLSVNTFKNAFYLNMALSEGFIDSAQRRNNVLSHAKELNYLPRSVRSAKATVQVDFGATGDNAPYVITKGQTFTAQVKNKSFLFSIPETLICASPNTSYTFVTDIYEGSYVKDSYIFDTTSDTPLRYKLTNSNVDTDSIVVNIFEDANVVGVIYRRAISLLDLDGSDQVYFIQCNAVDGNYEIMFGDNIIGYQPKNGSLVVIDYRVAEGSIANGSGRFVINFDPTMPFVELTSNMKITTLQSALGGAEQEDIETTRFYAPRWFQTQERAIVPMDYKVLMKIQFPEIASINAYGGENLTPPQYGKVVVVLNIANVVGLPQSKQTQYYNFLKARCPLTIFPIFTSPQFTFIHVTSVVRYNINVTNETISRVQTIVMAAITAYNKQFLNDFDVTFRLSQFTTMIDESDPSIVSNLTYITIYKELHPIPNIAQNIVMQFNVALVNDLAPTSPTHPVASEKTLYSSSFMYKGQPSILEDDGNGNIRIVNQSVGNYTTVVNNTGTINYDTGLVQLNNFIPDSFDGTALCVYVRPRDADVSCSLDTIILIDSNKVSLTVEQLQQ